jgi:ubiquitin carboxyl-terminal hydrolase 34
MDLTRKDSLTLSTVGELSDHADSPKRKRPRLNNDVPVGLELSEGIALEQAPSSGSSDVIHPTNLADDGIDPTVSERVSSQSSTPAENMADHNTRRDRERQTPETARGTSSPEVLSNNGSRSPIIEVIDDDSDGTIEGEAVSFRPSPAQCLANIVQQFPSLEDDVPPIKALRSAIKLIVDDRMDDDYYVHISSWFEDWLQAASLVDRSSKRRAIAIDIDFWTDLATLALKLIQKKTMKGLPRKRASFITGFFGAYLEIVTHLQDVDAEELVISSGPSSEPPRLISEKHLRNIHLIMQTWDRTSIWKALVSAAPSELDPNLLQKRILEELNENVLDFISHVKSAALNPRSWKYTWRSVLYGLQILNSTKVHFDSSLDEQADGAGVMKQFVRESISITEGIEQALLQDVSTTTAGVPVDGCASIALEASKLLSTLQVLDGKTARMFIKVNGHFVPKNLTTEDLATLAAESTALQLQWQLLLKGRMDLRIVSVKNIADLLVQLFERYRTVPSQQPVLLAIARWLIDNDVVDRLVGPESHPEILMRSDQILGFLIATTQWTSEMTDGFWNRVVTMQDQRLAAAALTALWRNVPFMDASLLAQFCDKISTVPMNGFSREMISVCEKIFRKLQEMPEGSDNAAALCLVLLAKAFSPGNVNGIAEELQKASQTWLRELSRQTLDFEQRKTLYQQCVMEIREGSSRAHGSVLAIWAMSSAHRTQDIVYVLQELDVLTHLAVLLCSPLDPAFNAREQQRILTVGLTLLGYITKQVPESNLKPDIAFRLWRHVLGDLAADDVLRNFAWDHVRAVMFELGTKQSPLISNILDSFINQLSPEYFTTGVLHFVETAIKYEEQRIGSSAESEDEIHTPALTELIWHLALDAPENSIEEASVSLLSKIFTQLHEKVPTTTIGATHAALVEKSLRQLQEAATAIRQAPEGSDQTTMDTNAEGSIITSPISCGLFDTDFITGRTESVDLGQHRRHFYRTVRFLSRFLADVKQDPVLNDQFTEAKLPSPRKDFLVESSSETTVTIKYQAITAGMQGDVKSLCVNVNASFADLLTELKQQTGFDKFTTFHAGKILHLDATPEHPASSLSQTGLLLVRNLGTMADSPGTSTSAAVGTSAAERAVSTHLDIIVDFLSLEDELSLPVYYLLHNFPPYGKIRDLVMLGPECTPQLFPKERLVALYSYNSMNRHLSAQLARGYNDETFLLKGIQVLTDCLVSERFSDMTLQKTQESACFLVETLIAFLRERPSSQALSAAVTNPVLTGQRLIEMLWAGHMNPVISLARSAHIIYATLLEACLQVRAIWDVFVLEPSQPELHYWLLTSPSAETVADLIVSLCNNDNNQCDMALTPGELAQHYWTILLPSIGTVTERGVTSKQMFRAAIHIFNSHCVVLASENTLRQYLATWTTCLSQHVHFEVPGQGSVDDLVLGLVHLVTTCISFLKAFSKQFSALSLAELLWHKYLFPSGNADNNGTTSVAQPILDSETRKQMYILLNQLCFDHAPTYHAVAQMLADVVASEAANPMQEWNANRSGWLRAPAGYSGLKNLTNTCYMNSLMTQLFMNTGFRAFVLGLQPEQKEKYNMVASMQELFGRMQAGYLKFTDTSNFARAVQPYDSEHIDVTIQMDVDEFYNLLFDRLENELPDTKAKDQLRSFWGGQLVTQIKSSDCDHVSERLEPFLAIQCEVKGKATLSESLQAYVEGDHMVGGKFEGCVIPA